MSTAEDIAISYDVSNDFYRLWLDQAMNYSCALFEGTDDLEAAQVKKLEWLSRAAEVRAGMRVLDVGCGWGANMRFLTQTKRVAQATGITLSRGQCEWIREQRWPDIHVELVSYRDYVPETPFDAAISIGMFEHLATPEEARGGRHVEIYRDYFRRVWQWTRPGSSFALQTVIGGRIPRRREVLRDIGWTTHTIFPGAIAPRVDAIIRSLLPYWELVELRTRRRDYQRTTAAWLERLRQNRPTICSRWGESLYQEYERYLQACVTAFAGGYQSLAQFGLRRIDEPNQ
jgi:cyclopropane-fatty-acyl-phospholipid synthase